MQIWNQLDDAVGEVQQIPNVHTQNQNIMAIINSISGFYCIDFIDIRICTTPMPNKLVIFKNAGCQGISSDPSISTSSPFS